MSDKFFSLRFGKTIWLTNHAIEAMSKRNVKLSEVKELIEFGELKEKTHNNAWIYHRFTHREDNLVCAAVVNNDALIIKTVMINWDIKI